MTNAAGLVKPGIWQRMRTDSATKGARDYHWAMIGITPDDTPDGHDDGHAFLLLRRHRYTRTVSYFLCWSPAPVPLAKLIAVAVARWRIGRSPAVEAGQRAGQRPGHHLDILAPLDRGQPARLRLPRRRRRLPARPRRQRRHPRAHPRHRPRAAQAAPRNRHPRPPPRQGPPRRLVAMAPTPPVPRPASPPALARLRRRGAAITNYNCRN